MGNTGSITGVGAGSRAQEYRPSSTPNDPCNTRLEELKFQRDKAEVDLEIYRQNAENHETRNPDARVSNDNPLQSFGSSMMELQQKITALEIQIANQQGKCEAEKAQEDNKLSVRFHKWILETAKKYQD